ncbi:YesN/AraC family two-component response regulator [Natranaerovirga hydrolytica]|uniref:Stage 0 sporulation protein A homolog n=1 Tax=Natranaerovirga hydrolytica TaxID=680378 RepID=A0A4R1MZ45_9FIRM|nr:response regulator [Natranaerovirga hydrolytica]TCK98598.1 YesN/AraC family two-component response regulator [Natranaerovirga hydrolytica]
MYKLLIVDDEVIERDAIRYVVTNYMDRISEIEEASNGQEAISVATIFQPDIIIMDIKMPGLNGIEASKILKRIDDTIGIIFLTAYDEFDIAHEAIKIGVEEFIVKPAMNERIVEVLNKTIHQIEKNNQLKTQKKTMEQKLNQVSRYLECEFLNSIVTGEIESNQVNEYLDFMGIHFKNGFAVVCSIHPLDEKMSHLQYNMLKKRFSEKLKTSLEERKFQFFSNQVRNTIYILVYGYKKTNRDIYIQMIQEDFNKAYKSVEGQLDIKLGIGEEYDNITQLWQSFSQGKIHAKKSNYVDSHNYRVLEEESQKLCNCILECEDNKILPITNNILDEIITTSKDISGIRLKIYEFIILFNNLFANNSQFLLDKEKIYQDISKIETKGQAKEYFQHYVYTVINRFKVKKVDPTKVIFDDIKKYIQQNYKTNLKLDDIAVKAGFSSYYFSKMFKKYYGYSLVDYITMLRINESKTLLKNPQNNIKSITKEIGYLDPNYFTRVFKKHEGITPTEYRQKTLNTGEDI